MQLGAVAVVLVGCGRIAFDPTTPALPDAAAGELWIVTSEDTFARAGSYASVVHGSSAWIEVKADNYVDFNREIFLKFSLQSVPATLVAARLNLQIRDDRSDGAIMLDVDAMRDDSWAESSLTWNNRPQSGDEVALVRPGTGASELEIDVMAQVRAEQTANDQQLSIRLRSTTALGPDGIITFHSRETVTAPPTLRIACNGGAC